MRAICRHASVDEEDDGGDDVWEERDDKQELCKFRRAPGSFEVSAAVEEGRGSDDQGEDVQLRERGGDQDPRMREDFAGNQSDPGYDLLGGGRCLRYEAIPSSLVDQRDANVEHQKDSSEWGNVDPQGRSHTQQWIIASSLTHSRSIAVA